jgi:hypothetical protein
VIETMAEEVDDTDWTDELSAATERVMVVANTLREDCDLMRGAAAVDRHGRNAVRPEPPNLRGRGRLSLGRSRRATSENAAWTGTESSLTFLALEAAPGGGGAVRGGASPQTPEAPGSPPGGSEARFPRNPSPKPPAPAWRV